MSESATKVGAVTRCFTFGFGHAHPNGFVRITQASYGECRNEMARRYGEKWAFDYSEEQIADQMKRFPQMYEVFAELPYSTQLELLVK